MSKDSSSNTYGAYHLHELINSGGMANIWHATDAEGAPFALRIMHRRLRFNFVAKRRFVRGCEILSQIHNHAYVIGYVEHGKCEGLPFLVMEYVESSNLKELFARGDEILDAYIGNILIDMAVALEHVHDSGFMHLDFKPENVLVTRNANVRLVDFDLAQLRPTKPKRMYSNPGTPAYMAPEQLLRQPVDHRADIFAFGVAAYELLTNKKPFPGESGREVARLHASRETTLLSPREHNSELPSTLEKIVMKCLEANPEDRYQDASFLVHDLETTLYVEK